jgi:hypothetical protein
MTTTRTARTCDKVHVAWHDALVVPAVVVLPGLCRQPCAMPAVMEEEQVPRPRVPDEPRELQPDVCPRGQRSRRGPADVEKDAEDVRLVKAEAVDEAATHTGDVVVACWRSPRLSPPVSSRTHVNTRMNTMGF